MADDPIDETHTAEALFWDCAAQCYDLDDVIEGTIFGFRCLRVGEQFVAMPANDALWVKLPEPRVLELIEAGDGAPCRPNGRVFREWVEVRDADEQRWVDLLHESIEFVRPRRRVRPRAELASWHRAVRTSRHSPPSTR